MLSRRQLIQLGLAGGGYAILSSHRALASLPRLFWDDPSSPTLQPFVQPLPVPPFLTAKDGERPFGSRDVANFFETQLTPQHIKDTRFFRVLQEEAMVKLHPDLPATSVWRYRPANIRAKNYPFSVGPTHKVFMNEPRCIRMKNNLPEDHVGFGVPETTVHYHGGHMEARSDGFPENDVDDVDFQPVIHHGEQFDYCYAMRDFGWSTGEETPGERPATQWYHDHLLDFTGPNVVRGLAGFYLVFDELDADDETKGLRLPASPYDLPLVVADRLLAPDGSLIYLPGSFDGFLGDTYLVNGAVQPFVDVKRRKYRLRLLNGSNARIYMFSIQTAQHETVAFTRIGDGGGLFSRPIRDLGSVQLSMAARADIVIDFSEFPKGTELFLVNTMDQEDGRGPGGKFDDPDLLDPEEAVQILKFIVGDDASDASQVPDELRPFDAIPADEIANATRRKFKFDRSGGGWAINGDFVDIDNPIARPKLNEGEVWTLENGGGGWWHPIHVHLEFMRILSRNGETPPLDEQDGMAKLDTVTLGPKDEVEVFFKFRDFPGPWVFHCHNIEHEDHFMMGRFDVED